MQLEAFGRPLRYRLRSGDQFVLRPGQPVDLPEDAARTLLRQAGDRVRVVGDMVKEPAAADARPIYWESENGIWHGPVKPEFLGRIGIHPNEEFYVIVIYQGITYPILADRLRSRQAFEDQERRGCDTG